MIAAALALVVLSVALLRAGWGSGRGLAAMGWTVGAVALAWLGWREGAWGVSVGLVVAMTVALGIVLYAALVAPPREARRARASAAPAIALPTGSEIGRRLWVFVLVVPLSFIAAMWFAFALNALIKGDGALEANSVSALLFAQPIMWTVLMSWQMMLPGHRQMLVPPLLAAALGTILWVIA